MALALSIPGVTVFAPSSAPEVELMLAEALNLDGPSVIRFPKTPAPWVEPGDHGHGLHARQVRAGDGSVCVLAVGKMVAAARAAAEELVVEGIDSTVWDVRVVSDPDPDMLVDAARHRLVVTAEDGVRQGGAGTYLADALRAVMPIGTAPPVVSLGIPRAYIAQGKPDTILAELGLDGPGVARSIRDSLEVLPEAGVRGAPAAPAPSRPATVTAKDTAD
jgi:1-deoxy-D-xylulose-5-phosphate synthase